MNKGEFLTVVDDIQILFMMPDFLKKDGKFDEKSVDTWYSVFSEMDFEMARKAVRSASQRKIYDHNLLAEIREDYDEIAHKEAEFRRNMNSSYSIFESYFFPTPTEEVEKLFFELVKSDTKDKAYRKASWLIRAADNATKENSDLDPIAFLKGIRK